MPGNSKKINKKKMSVKKVSIKDLAEKIKIELDTKMLELPELHRRHVDIIRSLNSFVIPNAFGIMGIIPIGGDFSVPKNPDAIIQNHDVAIGVIVGMFNVLGHPAPFEYVEWVIDSLTGLYLENNRPERLIYPARWEPMEERWENNEWWYRIIFNCPVDHYEKRFEEQFLNN
jgi:hypothetical protein